VPCQAVISERYLDDFYCIRVPISLVENITNTIYIFEQTVNLRS
jgi:hypothetical protein